MGLAILVGNHEAQPRVQRANGFTRPGVFPRLADFVGDGAALGLHVVDVGVVGGKDAHEDFVGDDEHGPVAAVGGHFAPGAEVPGCWDGAGGVDAGEFDGGGAVGEFGI